MKIKKDTRGFSLIELIIVMGIMAIFASAIIGTMGYLNAGRTKKASAKLNSKISYIQTETMTKKGNTYLYLYKKSDGIYMCTLNGQKAGIAADGFASRSELDSYLASQDIGDKLCDSKVTITGKNTAGGSMSLELSESNMLKIGYSKSTGAFTYCNDGDPGKQSDFYNCLELSGKETFKIKLIRATGKHYVDS